jgi:hypothetical protein
MARGCHGQGDFTTVEPYGNPDRVVLNRTVTEPFFQWHYL